MRLRPLPAAGPLPVFDELLDALPHALTLRDLPGMGKRGDPFHGSAAITQSWSNGQTEGQITKLKLVKRQMYGRAKIDLLQARLIGAP